MSEIESAIFGGSEGPPEDEVTEVDAESPTVDAEPEVAAEAPVVPAPAAEDAPADTSVFDDPISDYDPDPDLRGKLIAYAEETTRIFAQIEKLKLGAVSKEEWMTIMIFIAGQKARVSHMSTSAKSIYNKLYGDRFEELSHTKEDGKRITLEKVRTLAQRDVYVEQALSRRIEQAWHDLQDLLWSVKTVVESIGQDSTAPNFEEIPQELFNRPVDEL